MPWDDRIGRRIKLRDLHTLHAVMEAGSMSKAAGRLAVSVPVVSKSIADLERVLGHRLVDRTSRGIEFTAYGRALIARSGAAFDELRQGVQDIEFLADPAAGEVRVGSTRPLSASFVSAVINDLSGRYPRMKFLIRSAETESLFEILDARNVELLIARRFDGASDERMDFIKLYDDPYVIVAGAKSPWARRRKLNLEELVNARWTLPPPESLVGSLIVKSFADKGMSFPRATVIAFTHDVRNSLLATGNFLTILPRSLLRYPVPRTEFFELPVRLPIPSGPIGIFTLKGRTLSGAAALFTEAARAIAKSRQRP